jgi:hypothetical protein
MVNNIHICGCIKNCSPFVNDVFKNIDKIISLFDDYNIILAHDLSYDNTLELLLEKQKDYNLTLIDVKENHSEDSFGCRTTKLATARNSLLTYIRENTNDEFTYFIMIDFDEVSAGNMQIEVLEKYLHNSYHDKWDGLSFNRKEYYDIWALSIEPYVFSCWHFFDGWETYYTMQEFIKNKLLNCSEDGLVECLSAFNGFSIYRKNKFLYSSYEWEISKNIELMPIELVHQNQQVLGKQIVLNKSISVHSNGKVIENHAYNDCEHRHFHLKSIVYSNAKIRISPLFLFTE